MHLVVMSPSDPARRLFELLLGSLGHTCATAIDGDEALASLEAAAPQLVLIDVRDAGEDTLVLNALLHRRHPDVPRLLLQAGALRLVSGGTERVLTFSSDGAAFPSMETLQRALSLVDAERVLAVLRPAPGKA